MPSRPLSSRSRPVPHDASHSWKETESYLSRLGLRGIHPGLERMRALMGLLGRPETKFKAIHVTGTNGKGSVAAMLYSVLNRAGYRTALYTSPHLTSLEERFCVAGKNISRSELARWIWQCRSLSGKMEPELTYFEVLTAAAFCHFAEKKADLAVVEVGLGGRLDATNVLPAPEVCVLTNVSLEHTEYLGKTVEAIAAEKAAVLKSGAVCVTGFEGPALAIAGKLCRDLGIRLFAPGAGDSGINARYRRFCSLRGLYQDKNLPLAVKAVRALRGRGWKISEAALREGLKKTVWPGRFDGRLLNLGGRDVPVLLDGAHNPGAVRELVRALGRMRFAGKKGWLVFNALADKDVSAMLAQVLSGLKFSSVFIPRLGTERSSDPEALKRRLETENHGLDVRVYGSTGRAWSGIEKQAADGPPSWILATGSLYLVGETLGRLRSRLRTSKIFSQL